MDESTASMKGRKSEDSNSIIVVISRRELLKYSLRNVLARLHLNAESRVDVYRPADVFSKKRLFVLQRCSWWRKSSLRKKKKWRTFEHGIICQRALEAAGIKSEYWINRIELDKPLSENMVLKLHRRTEMMAQELLRQLDRHIDTRVHWKDVSLQTLKEFDLTWEWDTEVSHSRKQLSCR